MAQNLEHILNQLNDRIEKLETQRINQQQIMPNAVRQSHILGFIIFRGLDSALPTNGSTEVQAYFATDTNKLYLWNGTAWKSTTLT